MSDALGLATNGSDFHVSGGQMTSIGLGVEERKAADIPRTVLEVSLSKPFAEHGMMPRRSRNSVRSSRAAGLPIHGASVRKRTKERIRRSKI